ncbi:Uncharacterised protein [uncultured Clostridium sp.]|nr:Uncharacterised protein [uncultured Clostridium sp.]
MFKYLKILIKFLKNNIIELKDRIKFYLSFNS